MYKYVIGVILTEFVGALWWLHTSWSNAHCLSLCNWQDSRGQYIGDDLRVVLSMSPSSPFCNPTSCVVQPSEPCVLWVSPLVMGVVYMNSTKGRQGWTFVCLYIHSLTAIVKISDFVISSLLTKKQNKTKQDKKPSSLGVSLCFCVGLLSRVCMVL